jgi:hypothetical protein
VQKFDPPVQITQLPQQCSLHNSPGLCLFWPRQTNTSFPPPQDVEEREGKALRTLVEKQYIFFCSCCNWARRTTVTPAFSCPVSVSPNGTPESAQAVPAAPLLETWGKMQRNTFADDLDVASLQGMPDSHARAQAATLPTHAANIHHELHYRPAPTQHHNSGSPSVLQSLTSADTLATFDTNLELSPTDGAVRRGVLQDTYFPTWKDDSAGGLESPEEMQQKDPLATQVWKLYSKAKSQLPNAERMENLTWRMMSMNLRRLELERKGLVHDPTDVFFI